jgi:hypothetical protein
MDIQNFKDGINTNITNKTAPSSISSLVVGKAITDLADLTKVAVDEAFSENTKVQNVDFNNYTYLPNNKSAVSFTTGKIQNNIWFWDVASVITPFKPLDMLFVNSAVAGSMRIGLISVSGATSTLIYSTGDIIPPIVGINTYTPKALGFPDISSYPLLYLAVLNVNSPTANRLISYNTIGTSKSTPFAGGAITDSNIDLSYWIKIIDVKADNELLRRFNFFDQIQNFNITGFDKFLPFKRLALPGTTFTDSALYWTEKTNFITSSIELQEVRITGAYTGNVSIAFVTIVGTVATILHEIVKPITSIGETIFTFASLAVPALILTLPKVYIMYTNVTRPTNAVIVYNSSVTQDAIIVNKATKAISYGNYIFNVYLKVKDRSNPLIDKVKLLEYNQQQQGGTEITTFEGLKAVLATKDYIKLGSGTFTFTETLVIPTGKTIVGNGDSTVFTPAFGVDLMIDLSNSAPNLSGFKMVGLGAAVNDDSTELITTSAGIPTKTGKGTGVGIKLSGSNGAVLFGLTISNFNSAGIYGTGFGADNGFTAGVKLNTLFINDCYQGIEFDTRAEYSTLNMITARNNVIGISIVSGNVTVSNSHFTKNRVGVYVGQGDNDSHGSFTGVLMNHNTLRSLYTKGLTNGEKFTGCDFFQGDRDS